MGTLHSVKNGWKKDKVEKKRTETKTNKVLQTDCQTLFSVTWMYLEMRYKNRNHECYHWYF